MNSCTKSDLGVVVRCSLWLPTVLLNTHNGSNIKTHIHSKYKSPVCNKYILFLPQLFVLYQFNLCGSPPTLPVVFGRATLEGPMLRIEPSTWKFNTHPSNEFENGHTHCIENDWNYTSIIVLKSAIFRFSVVTYSTVGFQHSWILSTSYRQYFLYSMTFLLHQTIKTFF